MKDIHCLSRQFFFHRQKPPVNIHINVMLAGPYPRFCSRGRGLEKYFFWRGGYKNFKKTHHKFVYINFCYVFTGRINISDQTTKHPWIRPWMLAFIIHWNSHSKEFLRNLVKGRFWQELNFALGSGFHVRLTKLSVSVTSYSLNFSFRLQFKNLFLRRVRYC